MDTKGKERGILKLEPRSRPAPEAKSELTPQGPCDRPISSPQPSIDRLSVTWADPESMTSSGVNLFNLPSDTPISNEVKFSPSGGDVSEDEDYSMSLTAVIRQRRASVRRSRKGRARRSSSPFLPDDNPPRRRSSVFTTSSGDTAISIDEHPVVTQEQIFENIRIHKEVLGLVKQQPWEMRRKLKVVHHAKAYIKRHEGQLQERLAQSKSTRDIYARINILIATKWQQLKREAANTSNLLIPWELRIKEIESHFGSVVASYFTFLRWLFWVNLVIAFILLVFVIIPEYLTANPLQDGERKIILDDEKRNATNLLTLWEFEGILKYSPIFYGYYSNVERPEYRMPLAYFLTGLVVYIYSFVAILRNSPTRIGTAHRRTMAYRLISRRRPVLLSGIVIQMAENSRMSKLSEKEDECIFSWKLFTGWDFMIGNAETAHNRIASVILGFKEALLEEAEKKRNLRNWRVLALRGLVNIVVLLLLAVSVFAVITVVSHSDDNSKSRSWWRENETTIVVTAISITFPVVFEYLGLCEHYHPRKQLRLQLARIMGLNMLNLYSLIFALFGKIEGMSVELVSLQPTVAMNATPISEVVLNESMFNNIRISSESCIELLIPCPSCKMEAYCSANIESYNVPVNLETYDYTTLHTTDLPEVSTNDISDTKYFNNKIAQEISYDDYIQAENLIQYQSGPLDENDPFLKEIERIRKLSANSSTEAYDVSSEIDDNDLYDSSNETFFSSNDDIVTDFTSTHSEPLLTSIITNDLTYTTMYYTDIHSNFNTQSNYDTNITETDKPVSDNEYNSGISSGNTFAVNNDLKTTIEEQKYFATTEPNRKKTTFEMITKNNYDITTKPTQIDNTDYSSTDSKTDFSSVTPYKITSAEKVKLCPNIHFNCSLKCAEKNITQAIFISNCAVVSVRCYLRKCVENMYAKNMSNSTNVTMINTVYTDKQNRKIYNLTIDTKKKLLKLCWETMFGQELVKLTMMDLVFVILGTLFMDFFKALFVRYMNRCWCWDLEKKYPQYGDFKIAENILHLINNQGMVWMGMFFSPGLVILNVVKLMIMMYLRSWAVMTCNVPHEVVFRVSKSNNFYLALLLTMLFLCVLPVGYAIVWVKPSWHCGPFSEYDKIYKILTSNIYKVLPKSLNFALQYIASPAIVIPLLVLLILIIYYLISLTNSLREANNDLKIQLRRERTEERRKMFQLAGTIRRSGFPTDNTPFARWKKALPSLPISKSIDSDDKKPGIDEDLKEPKKSVRKKGIFEKIVGMALDKRGETCHHADKDTNIIDDETDTDFHEGLPKDILKIKDITLVKRDNTKNAEEFKTKNETNIKVNEEEKMKNNDNIKSNIYEVTDTALDKNPKNSYKNIKGKQNSESSNQSKQSDSIGSVIPVITISTTESDDEMLQGLKEKHNMTPELIDINNKDNIKSQGISKAINTTNEKTSLKRIKKCSDIKSLRRQNSVESVNENRFVRKSKSKEDGHKYQYSL